MANAVYLDYAALDSASVVTEPFRHLIATKSILLSGHSAIAADFPEISTRGSLGLEDLNYGPCFAQLIEELRGEQFRSLVARKFALDLESYKTLVTVRGICSATNDGKVHQDLSGKIITVLLYLNESWDDERGRLRLLSSQNIDDYFAEISPEMGNMVIFERCESSWHGFKPLDGRRRALQLNWVTEEHYRECQQIQQRFSVLRRLSRDKLK